MPKSLSTVACPFDKGKSIFGHDVQHKSIKSISNDIEGSKPFIEVLLF
jgi:hypothetical protein